MPEPAEAGVVAHDAMVITSDDIGVVSPVDEIAVRASRRMMLTQNLAVWEEAAANVPATIERAEARLAAIKDQCAGVIASRDAARAALEADAAANAEGVQA